MFGITIVAPSLMEAHVTGCDHIAKAIRKYTFDGGERLDRYEGETVADAVVAADTGMAAWFGHEADPYSEAAHFDGCWKVATCKVAPCLAKAMKGLDYNGVNAPKEKS